MERVRLIWQSVFFLDGWRDWIIGDHSSLPDSAHPTLNKFISSELYRDSTFGAIGLTMTVFVHSVFLPGVPLDVSLLGSDACEHYFGVIRSYIKYKSNCCCAEFCNILTRVVGELKERAKGDIAFPNLGEHGSRTTRAAMLKALASLREGRNSAMATAAQGSVDPSKVAEALEKAMRLAEQAAAIELRSCGIVHVPRGAAKVYFNIPSCGNVPAASSPAELSPEDQMVDGFFATEHDAPLTTTEYLCELHETWLHCMQVNDVEAALEALTDAATSMRALGSNAVAQELSSMAVGSDD
ncbi:hypothetical protein OAO87_02245, partial [bacterium]|nr:hypothetical protein [bacterium]